MCGRYTLKSSANDLKEAFPLFDLADYKPRYNIAPTQNVAAIRQVSLDDEPAAVALRWGLIPFWAKDEKIGNRLINARSESVAEKTSFRAAFKKRRCLILADGFYEWQKVDGQKQPYFIHLQGERPFAFAGLWERWDKGDEPIESCTILTTDANKMMKPIHNRMPVILPQQAYEQWLDPEFNDKKELLEFLGPFDPGAMDAYPISTHVNNPKNEGPRCVEPLNKK